MNQVFLTEKEIKDHLFPFTLTRHAIDIRIGILTIREKWEAYLKQPVALIDEQAKPATDATIISGNIIPSRQFIHSLVKADGQFSDSPAWDSVKLLQHPWNIFMWNDWALRQDFDLLTANRQSAPIPPGVQSVNPENIFIEDDAKISYCLINASTGPVYIGKHAEIMEGAMIRGPVALCERSVVKMGTRIYGATTIGPCSTVGGEIKNSVIFGYSNKGHDGYLGDSVIGEWCNLGAGTSNSNVKNNAGDIKIWDQQCQEYIVAGVKCGLIMGDYSRSAINTSFNTGTVVGVCVNVFGEGLTPKFIPSFTWGIKQPVIYELSKALADIENWKKLKNVTLTEDNKTQLKRIFEKLNTIP